MTVNLKILHVEDDPLYADLVQCMLMDDAGVSDYDIVHVESLKLALQQLKSQGFGAVLLDLALGDVSGLDNVRAIRQQNPELPIIVVSGTDNQKMALKAMDEGAHNVIVKGRASHHVIRSAIHATMNRPAAE